MSKPIRVLTLVILLTVGVVSLVLAQGTPGSMADGEKAFLLGEYDKAENIFSVLLEKEPDNFILLRGQANTKIKLKKFAEAGKTAG